MLKKMARRIRNWINQRAAASIAVEWVKQDSGSRLASLFIDSTFKTRANSFSRKIEQRARVTNEKGLQPLWEGYGQDDSRGSNRLPDDVRTDYFMGNLYSELVSVTKPATIVEFGTAFGVSGMYFLAGLAHNGRGKLFTFEPNKLWADIARQNLSAIGAEFELVNGTFEDNVKTTLPASQTIDLAFIDAIHTREFVICQLEIVLTRAAAGAIVILDDINFSDSMKTCWEEVSADPRFVASVKLGNRVGMLELHRAP
ncbi:MAG TPA: class I SAM-dependent methyltransferase [Candidimonas sp.]|nr:class I SAM-dependent methyltransferase [Candidimonas sp.]